MTTKQKDTRNKNIALMLGWTLGKLNDKRWQNQWFDKNGYRHEKLLFHEDWNLLMDAVEFINKHKNFGVDISSRKCSIYNHNTVENISGKNTKDAVFEAVSDFAEEQLKESYYQKERVRFALVK